MLQVNRGGTVMVSILGSRRERRGSDLSLAGVVINACGGRWSLALEVPVEDELEIVEVVVLRAGGEVVCGGDGESGYPSVVRAHSTSHIPATLVVDDSLEVLRSDTNVRRGIEAVSVLRALFGGDLHHANLTRTAGDVWVAARFLKGDGSEEDGRDTGLGFHVLEDGEVV